MNTETFEKLYDKRRQINVEFVLKIKYKSIDSTTIYQRRNIALGKKSLIRHIIFCCIPPYLLPDNFQSEFHYNELNIETTVLDLKNKVYSINDLRANEIQIYFLNKNRVLLDDNQLLVDVFLDDTSNVGSFYIPFIFAKRGIFADIKVSIPKLNNEETIIKYPVFEFGSINPEDIKFFIRESFKISIDQQLLCFDDNTLKLADDLLYRWFMSSYVGENLLLKVIVLHTDDQHVRDFYNQNDIKMKDPVKITSGADNKIWYYHYKGTNYQSLNEFLHEKFEIHSYKFWFFIEGKRVDLRKNDIVNCKELKVAIQADDIETDCLQQIKKRGLSRIHSIMIRSQRADSILCTFPLSMFAGKFILHFNIEFICETISERYEELSNTKIWLTFNDERLHEDTEVKDLFVQDDEIKADLMLTLFVHPNKIVKDFCEKHHLVYLREISISFLTGKFTIDLFSQDSIIITVEDLKKTIYRLKNIPPHLQSLFNEKISDSELSSKVEISSLNTFIIEDSLHFSLIVKPAKDVSLNIHCDPALYRQSIQLKFKESDTFADVKQLIATVTNCPFSMISISNLEQRQLKFGENLTECDDEKQLWNLEPSENESIDLFATLRFIVSIQKADSTIDQRSFPVVNFESKTVRDLGKVLQKAYKQYGLLLKLVEKPEIINLTTKLKDVGKERIEYIAESSSSTTCNLS